MRVEEVEVVLVGDKTTCLRQSLSTMESRMVWVVLMRSMLKSPRRRRDLESDGGNLLSEASRLAMSDGSLDGGL